MRRSPSALPRLRARSRDLVRNNPYARRAIAALVGNAIGTGITLGIKNEQLGEALEAVVRRGRFFGDHDLYGLQAMAARAGFESGDCLIVRERTSSAEAGRSGVPLKLKVLEGDFLDTNKTGRRPTAITPSPASRWIPGPPRRVSPVTPCIPAKRDLPAEVSRAFASWPRT
jgi:hypothetical protein